MNPRSDSGEPAVSVIVIVLGGGDTLVRCLKALAGQVRVPEVEIIVPYEERHQEVYALASAFPEVRFLPVEGARTYAELRTVGVRAAHGQVVALTEDHCLPRPDWCDRLLQAHAGPWAAVGGAVEKLAPDAALNWALYLADYVRYANPRPEGAADHLTDCNVSYKRAALDAVADVWAHEFHEPEVHAALRGRGGSLLFAPYAVVHQQRSVRFWDAVKDRYAFGRLFGSRRVGGATPTRRLLYIGATPLLPLLLVGRVGGHVFRKRRYTGAFLRAFPFVLLLSTVWAGGEFIGYLTGEAVATLTPGQQERAGASG